MKKSHLLSAMCVVLLSPMVANADVIYDESFYGDLFPTPSGPPLVLDVGLNTVIGTFALSYPKSLPGFGIDQDSFILSLASGLEIVGIQLAFELDNRGASGPSARFENSETGLIDSVSFLGPSPVDVFSGLIPYTDTLFTLAHKGGDCYCSQGEGWRADYAWTFEVEQSSVVPVPASVWLFGSGLIGLIGIARRKKA